MKQRIRTAESKVNKMSQASPAPLVKNEISHALRTILVMNKKRHFLENSFKGMPFLFYFQEL